MIVNLIYYCSNLLYFSLCATSCLQDGRGLVHAAAMSGNEELVHMLVEDYALAPGVSMVKAHMWQFSISNLCTGYT